MGLSHILYTRSSGTVEGGSVSAFQNETSQRTFSSNTLPQLGRKLDLGLDVLLKVDVDIETAALIVRNGVDKGVIRLTRLVCWRVHV